MVAEPPRHPLRWGCLLVGLVAACAPGPDPDEEALSQLLAAAAEGRCQQVFDITAEGFVASTTLRADAAQVAVGRCEYRADEFADAAVRLETPADRDPANVYTPRALYYRSRALQRGGRPVEAELSFRHLARRFSHTSYHDDGLYHHGRVLLSMDLPEEAADRFVTLGGLPALKPSMEAKAQYGQGRAHELAGALTAVDQRYDSALSFYQRVLAEHGAEAVADNALYRIGKVHQARADFGGAIAAFDALIADYPQSGLVAAAAYQRARSLLSTGDFRGADQAFDAFLAAYPDSVFADNAMYRKGRSLYEAAAGAGDEPALLGAADLAFSSLFATYPDSLFGLSASYFSGRARYRLGNDTGAAQRFQDTLARGPSGYDDNARYYLAMTSYHLASDEPSYLGAVAQFDVVRALHPDSGYLDNAMYFRARSLQRAGHLEEARDAFLAFVGEFPDSSYADNALYRRVLVLLALGDCAEAASTGQWLHFAHPASPYGLDAQTAIDAACGGGL